VQTQAHILLFTIDQLEAPHIPYFLTGSIAVGVYTNLDLPMTLMPSWKKLNSAAERKSQ